MIRKYFILLVVFANLVSIRSYPAEEQIRRIMPRAISAASSGAVAVDPASGPNTDLKTDSSYGYGYVYPYGFSYYYPRYYAYAYGYPYYSYYSHYWGWPY